MAWIGGNIVSMIEKNSNSLNDVLFTDPFTDETRKAKRNVLIASFVCLLIATLRLEVTGFAGLTAGATGLGNELAQGLACTVVIYLFVGFLFHAFVDYSAWNFEQELLLTQPYVVLIEHIKSNAGAVQEQIKNAVEILKNPRFGTTAESTATDINSAHGQLSSIAKHQEELHAELTPLLASWGKTIASMDRLTWRLRARFVMLWVLDIGLPVLVALFAIYKSYPHIATVARTLWFGRGP